VLFFNDEDGVCLTEWAGCDSSSVKRRSHWHHQWIAQSWSWR